MPCLLAHFFGFPIPCLWIIPQHKQVLGFLNLGQLGRAQLGLQMTPLLSSLVADPNGLSPTGGIKLKHDKTTPEDRHVESTTLNVW